MSQAGHKRRIAVRLFERAGGPIGNGSRQEKHCEIYLTALTLRNAQSSEASESVERSSLEFALMREGKAGQWKREVFRCG